MSHPKVEATEYGLVRVHVGPRIRFTLASRRAALRFADSLVDAVEQIENIKEETE